jgi:hypothetical protein
MDTPNDCNDCLEILKKQYPNTPLLALGQTVLWDEPTKATLFLRGLNNEFIAGVHDTDYFAKLPGHPAAAKATPFVAVAHDDVNTRGLWSAAGEMSRLFGSEDVPTRERLASEAGVQLSRLTTEEQARFTTAWGWTGLIQTGWQKSVVAEIPLKEIEEALLAQIAWATENSPVGEVIQEQVKTYARAHPEATLPDLYEYLLPHFWQMLLGETPSTLKTTRTTQLLQFNKTTATLPRFAFLELFLSPKTRNLARDAYNLAVQGSDISPLESFGEDALPFDLFIPSKGRGTMHLTPGGTLTIDATEQIVIKGKPIVSVIQLAERIEATFGTNAVLIGKAITLIPLLATEFIFAMHEGASGYTGRTVLMLEHLRKKGATVPTLHPILRIKYDTWSSLSSLSAADSPPRLSLPAFLQQATGRKEIVPDDFAACWKERVQDEKQLLRELANAQKPRALIRFLRDSEAEKTYEAATQTLLRLRQEGLELYNQRHTLYGEIRRLKARYNALQHQRGTDFRTRTQPLNQADMQAREEQFAQPMAHLRDQIQTLTLQARTLKNEQEWLEEGVETTEARATLRAIETKNERRRAALAQNALQTVYGLPHTSYRPSFWWFPQVDPSGNWLRKTAETAHLYFEVL